MTERYDGPATVRQTAPWAQPAYDREMTVLVAWDEVADAGRLVRLVAADLVGRDPGPVHHVCPQCGSVEHGAPYVDAAVHISIAHATGLSIVAVTAAGPVGVDVELEADREWVRAEAIGKAHRTGILTASAVDQPGLWVEDLTIANAVVAVAVLSSERPEVRVERGRAARS
jgi:hypothetical protein